MTVDAEVRRQLVVVVGVAHRVAKSWLSKIGVLQPDAAGGHCARAEHDQIAAPRRVYRLGDRLFSDSVQGRVGDLGKALREEVDRASAAGGTALRSGYRSPSSPWPRQPVCAIGRMISSTSSSVIPKTRCRNTARVVRHVLVARLRQVGVMDKPCAIHS